ncbi:polysaccharide biosynthesis protein [Candidatus Pseudothioglobus singularis]|nr:nucleoside-diphosphate sugar epimerase/dehydratase [Candidatus Pseudothioglobus singularis]MDB4848160.1 polysaccharide biosynthesis protein [Candidatus Pseudothioglobus singularis]
MIQTLLKLPRKTKQGIIFLFDLIAIVGVLFISFAVRLGYWFYPAGDSDLLLIIFAAPILALPIFYRFGFYHEVVRYVGFKAIWYIFQGVSFYATLWGLITFMAAIEFIPRSVILINWLLVLLVIAGSRLLFRWILSEENRNNSNILIYGAGSAGRQLSTALNGSREYNPVAFIDDANELYNNFINGLKIYSQDDLKFLIEKKNIKEVFLAIPSLSRNRRKEIINYLELFPVLVRSLPGVSELAQGKVKVNDLLDIDVNDLLGRELVSPNKSLLKTNIFEKVVLVTGAGGSIGSELCRQILSLNPKKIVLYEMSESSLYIIEQELINIKETNVEIFPVIGSIDDKNRMQYIFNFYGVQTIYHAAAYKHVPLVEYNQSQGVLNNAIGTKLLAEAAILENVEMFVLISTDKAVRPTSVMGVSKRIAELVLQALAKQPNNTCFTMVRFGNVLDSSGSVIPLFKQQIKNGGPVTVTHSKVVRYFMTIPEAVELVIQAGAMAKGGEVFVLDMGEPILIHDLAVKMIQLSGLQLLDESNPNGDIEIKYTGLRPGEKLYEELLVDGKFSTTENKLIMRAEEDMLSWEKLEPLLVKLEEVTLNLETDKIYNLLSQLVPQFNPQSNTDDIEEGDTK